MATMYAKRPGACADCGKALDKGTLIRWFPGIGALCAVPCVEGDPRDRDAAKRTASKPRRGESRPAFLARQRLERSTTAAPCADCGNLTESRPDGWPLCGVCECQRRAPRPIATTLAPAAPVESPDPFAAGIEAARAMLARLVTP